MYIFAIGEFFASQTRRYGFILLGTLVDISTPGDSAYSDEVVFLIVHNLFLGILGVSAFRAKGYRFKVKPVYRFLFCLVPLLKLKTLFILEGLELIRLLA